jgi:3-phenylpropionate/trans-cinnamate dioxygenase ferredoxin reductase subunit
MAEQSAKYVIVGGGLAGASAVEGIRELDKEGSITLVTREPELPYHRPPLSKDFLRGETPQADIYVHDDNFYRENHVTLLTGHEATALDAKAKTVQLDNGDTLHYERLLLATGSGSRHLDTPGGDLPGVHYLRTLADSQKLKGEIRAGRQVVLIGTGFIGVEVAASATQMGAAVTMLGMEHQVWEMFGPQVAAFITTLLQGHGIKIVGGDSVASIERSGDKLQVHSKGGHTLSGDLVLAGVGATPNTSLAEQAGLKMAQRGVDVNQYLQSSDPDIYVAGDIAAFDSAVYGRKLRIEHWDVAQNSGKQAGRNLAGANEEYTVLPYFFSDEFDVTMEYVGNTRDWDEIIVRGDPTQKPFTVLYVKDDHIVAALFINNSDDVEPAKKLIGDKVSVKENRARLESGAL